MSGASLQTIACYLCGAEARRRGEKNGHTLYRCGHCAFLFVSPLPRSTKEVYGEDYFGGAKSGFGYVDYDADKEPMVPTFQKYLALIKQNLENVRKPALTPASGFPRLRNSLRSNSPRRGNPSAGGVSEHSQGGMGTLLDVGAATGFFVNLAREAGFDASGVELSEHAARAGRARGLDIKTGVIADVDGVFDCITMLDVIEHVPDPRADIRKAASLLRPGGVLVINTPDCGSLFARIMGLKWHLVVPPEHLYYFNRKNLRRMVEEEGFEVIMNTTIGKSFTPAYILKTLHKWTKIALFNRIAAMVTQTSLSCISIPINLKDNMFIVARRRA